MRNLANHTLRDRFYSQYVLCIQCTWTDYTEGVIIIVTCRSLTCVEGSPQFLHVSEDTCHTVYAYLRHATPLYLINARLYNERNVVPFSPGEGVWQGEGLNTIGLYVQHIIIYMASHFVTISMGTPNTPELRREGFRAMADMLLKYSSNISMDPCGTSLISTLCLLLCFSSLMGSCGGGGGVSVAQWCGQSNHHCKANSERYWMESFLK